MPFRHFLRRPRNTRKHGWKRYKNLMNAKSQGASQEEVIGAVLVGLPPVGHRVVQALPAALEAYDGKKDS